MLNSGTHRLTIAMSDRSVTGLHVCLNCVAIVKEAWPTRADAMLLVSGTIWQGPCDLCRYTATLSMLLSGRPEPDPEPDDA
jgi:hypothetical protein